MNFGEAIASGFSNYVNFQGRSRRSAFWWWQLFVFLCGVVAAVIDSGMASGGSDSVGVVGLLLNFAFFLPSLAIQVRRLHDTNHSGWWVLIAFTIIGLIPLFIWLCLDSDGAANAYGADPKPGGHHPAMTANSALDLKPSPFSGGFGGNGPVGPTGDVLERLEHLGRLRDQGVLTDEEFNAQKAKLLGN